MHSTCSIDEQRMLLRPPEPGRVKVVLCTNIAESSLTIPDAAAIIDSCLCRDMHWDKMARALKLQDDWISRESALQRTGRCGRVQPGEVYRLVPRAFFENVLPSKCVPEIRRVPLEECILRTIRGPFKDVEEILSRCIDPPDAEDVRAALQNLVDLGLVVRRPDPDTLGKMITTDLTPLGRITAELPVPWQMGMFLVYAKSFGLLEEAIVIAAGAAVGTPFKRFAVLPVAEHEIAVRFSGGFRCDMTANANAYFYWATEREKLNLGGFTGVSMAAKSLDPTIEGIAAAEFRWCEMNSLDLRQLREIDNLVFALRGKLSAFGLCPQPRKSEVAKRVFYRRELVQSEHLGIAVPGSQQIAGRGRRDGGQVAPYLSFFRKLNEGMDKDGEEKKKDKVFVDSKEEYMKTPGQTSVVLSHVEFALRLPEGSFIKTHSAEEIAEIKRQYINLTDEDFENLQGIESYEAGLAGACEGNVCRDETDDNPLEITPKKDVSKKSKKRSKNKRRKRRKRRNTQLGEFDIDDDADFYDDDDDDDEKMIYEEDNDKEEDDDDKDSNKEGEEYDFWNNLVLNTRQSKDNVLVLQSLLAAVYPQNLFKVTTNAVAKPIWDMWVNVPDRWDPHNVVELAAARFWNDPASYYFRNFTANGLRATEYFEDLASTAKEPPFFLNLEEGSVRPLAGTTVIESKKLIPESAFSEGVVRMHKIGNKNFNMSSLTCFSALDKPSSQFATATSLKAALSQHQRLEEQEKEKENGSDKAQQKFHAFGQTFYVPLIKAGDGEVDVDAEAYPDAEKDGEGDLSRTTKVRLYVNPSMNAAARFVYQSGSLHLYVANLSLAYPLSPPPLSKDLLELVRLKASPRRGCLFRAPRRIGISTDIFYQQSEKTGHIVCSARTVSMFPDDALCIAEVIPLVFLRDASYRRGQLRASYLGCSISQYASIPREYINGVERVRRWIEVSFQELFKDAAYWPLKHSVGEDTSLKFTREEARLYGTTYRSEKAARKGLLKLIRSNDIVLSTLNTDDYEVMRAYAMAAANMKPSKDGNKGFVTGMAAMELAPSSLTSNTKTEYFTKLDVDLNDDSDYDSNYVDDC